MVNDFFEKLKASKWKGCVAEIGLGVPFTSWLLSHSGASKVLLHMECPYAKEFQLDFAHKSISKEFVAETSWLMMKKALDRNFSNDHLFSLCVSGAHKKPDERGETHGWICISYGTSSEARSFLHFTISKLLDRQLAIQETGRLVQWFLEQVLFREQPWEQVLQGTKYIDVIQDRDITIQAHLALNDPLFYYQGEFWRPIDAIRNNTVFYQGSFNPPTKAHDLLGGDCVYVLNRYNVRKGRISSEDLAHRIKMLDLLNKKVLITSENGLISGLHKFLVKGGAKGDALNYILGTDTFNALGDPIYQDEDFASLARDATFLVHERPGHPIKQTEGLKIVKVVTPPEVAELSSSAARISGNGLDDRVACYAKENFLYEDYTSNS